jgi:two-component system, NtrC family, sensor kinase
MVRAGKLSIKQSGFSRMKLFPSASQKKLGQAREPIARDAAGHDQAGYDVAISTADMAAAEILHRAGLAVASALSLEDVLQEVIAQAVRMVHAASGVAWIMRIGLHDETGKEHVEWSCAQFPVSDPSVPCPPLASSPAGLAATALQSGQVRRSSVGAGSGQAAHAEIAVPFETANRTVGVLHLRSKANAAFDPARETLLAIFCEQAAGAMVKARLFEQLQHAKREWEMTFDGMLDGVAFEGPDGRILRANRALATMLNLDITEILGRRREELHPHLPNYQLLRPLQCVEHDPTGLNIRNGEFRFGAPERIISEMVFAVRLTDRVGGRGAGRGGVDASGMDPTAMDSESRSVRVMRDITEQRRLQEQVLQTEKLAALGELVSGVAHELNNPLTTVVGYAQLLESDAKLPGHVRRQIHNIHTEAVRAAHIVQNLLAFARREEPRKMQISVNDVVRSVVRMREYQLQAHNTRVIAAYDENVPPVWGDAHQLQQVFLNIINNAHQAVQEWRGGGEIHIATQAVAVAGAPGVSITITDNGPGIAPDHLRRVFDPFFTTKRPGEGTGLGMSISLRTISNHGGRIWAESNLGHGARFFVELPGTDKSSGIEDDEPAQSSEAGGSWRPSRLQPAAEYSAPDGRHILVVDDEEPVVTLISEVLGLDGHKITPAFNGAEALLLLEEHDYDLILSDVRMPAVGGPTFFEILQTTRPDLLPRVIFVTGDTVSRSTQEFLRKASRPVLAKPFDPERLRALVSETLAKNAPV